MAEEKTEDLQTELKGYKAKAATVTKATIAWERDLIFAGRTPQGYELDFDAEAQWGCKPTEALLLSLGGCMAGDIVSILKKMRVELASLRLELQAVRNPEPPQYFRSVEMVFHLSGKGLDAQRVERAVALSRQTYCSVYNTLRPDLDLTVRCIIEETPAPDSP